ncbi:TPA: carboxypeptidase regulatory-like domain-containing protein, partial [Candidatus Micrarchaeota archaeon]|nr:carboxypeptidase regulatory-like domain-containing protein [Candidatus Micrarchaeota archaeon]
MKRVKYLLLLFPVGVAVAFMSGCLFIPARPTGTVEGYVVDAGAGSPVVGALVTAYPAGDEPVYWVGSPYFSPTAITDENGYYRLTLPKGTYVITAVKEGFATTRVEGVVVGSTAKLDIIQKPVFHPGWPLEPPEV